MMKTNILLIEKLNFKQIDKKTIIELINNYYIHENEGEDCLNERELLELDRLQFEN